MPRQEEFFYQDPAHWTVRGKTHVPRYMAEAENELRNALEATDFETPLSENRRYIQSAYGSLVDSLPVIGINEQNHSKTASLTDPVNIDGIPGEFQFSFGFKNGDRTATRELTVVRKRNKGFTEEYISLCCDGTASYELVENSYPQESAKITDRSKSSENEYLAVRRITDIAKAITRSITNPDLHPVEMQERFKLIRSNLINHLRAIGVLPEIYDPNAKTAIKPFKIPGTRHSWEVYLAEDQNSDPHEKAQYGTGLFIEHSVIGKGRHIKNIRQYILWEDGHAIYIENGKSIKKLELKLAEDESSSVINNPHLLLSKFAYLENVILVPQYQSIVGGLFRRLGF